MSKKLSEMTLDELWQLFPIVLTEHDGRWQEYYGEMAALLGRRLSEHKIKRISHIGSTAVEAIWAKPIIDILVELAPGQDMSAVAGSIVDIGFTKMSESDGRMSLNMGYTEQGFADKVFHLHLRHAGDNDELYFRDLLNDDPAIAREYERLKLGLWRRYEHDRDAYTDAKSEFIISHTQAAKGLYEGRYL